MRPCRATSSSRGSLSATFLSVNRNPFAERNSFSAWQSCQLGAEYTVISISCFKAASAKTLVVAYIFNYNTSRRLIDFLRTLYTISIRTMTDPEFYKKADFLQTLFDAVPLPLFVVDGDVQVQLLNRAAASAFDLSNEAAYKHRGGDLFGCLFAEGPEGCGQHSACADCVVRNAVGEAIKGTAVMRRKTVMTFVRNDEMQEGNFLVTAAPFVYEGTTFALLTLEDINELLQLRTLLPICANCKKIRNEQDYWESVERYFKTSLDLDFTHSICPECMVKLYPEIAEEMRLKDEGSGK